jgi:hypothetical protein
MFKRNDIIKLVNNHTMDAKPGALGIVIKDEYNDGDGSYYIGVKWLDITSHLNGVQSEGGYNPDRFELVVPGASNKDSLLIEIEKELDNLTYLDLQERFLNILGGFDEVRLENILEDLKGNN